MTSLLLARTPAAFWGMTAAVANGMFRIALVPIFVTPMFDQILMQNDVSGLVGLLARAGLIAVIGSIMLFAQDALLGRAAAHVSAFWRDKLYTSLLQQPKLPASSGALTGRIASDLRDVDIYYQFGLGTLVAESVAALAIVSLLLVSDVRATLVLLLLALPLALVLRMLGERLEQVTTHNQDAIEHVSAHLQEGLKHHSTVRAFGIQAFMRGRLAPDNLRAQHLASTRSKLAAVQIPVAQVLVFAGLMVMVSLLVTRVSMGNLTAGQVVSYITLVALLSTPVQLLPKGYAMFKQARAAAVRLHALAGDEIIVSKQEDVEIDEPLRLELHNLTFAYTPTDIPLYKNLSLSLSSPGLVALRGPSGCGKTTLLQLLLGFQTPTHGHMQLNQHHLTDVPDAQRRQLTGYLPQDSLLFHGSLRDNLCLGQTFSDDVLEGVLTTVNLRAEFAAQGITLDSLLGEDGAGVSGGQRQRLALARLILRDPPMLLLDEPSASLDDASEQVIIHVLKMLADRKLILVVAHRPALIDAADTVISFKPNTGDAALVDVEMSASSQQAAVPI
ncbi:MAG: ABC transporter ATP-binding protein [Deinococcota bacterium]